ncbi:hypothetical protein D0Y65_033680 [Glycine soja]|uniref:Uncharacterized protein n=1 Tax=Glycine soja TaxID=3848 RepID=A0A445HMJ4_GLYSO|nr:hypothetical protein D0Y65_033680 [Glycine soja]
MKKPKTVVGGYTHEHGTAKTLRHDLICAFKPREVVTFPTLLFVGVRDNPRLSSKYRLFWRPRGAAVLALYVLTTSQIYDEYSFSTERCWDLNGVFSVSIYRCRYMTLSKSGEKNVRETSTERKLKLVIFVILGYS